MDRSTIRLLVQLLACAALLHAGLFLYDHLHPEVFLNADRAITRMRTIEALARLIGEGASLGNFFESHGIIGDYLPQAMLYMLGGRTAIVVGQVLLFLVSLAALFGMTFHVTGSRKCAGLSALLYLLLPHSLVFPHMLCSEAIFDPLVVISFYFTSRVVLRDRGHAAAGPAGLFLGIATLVRPITALWPLAVGAAMHLAKCSKTSRGTFLILSYLPLLVWMSIMHQLSGAFSFGSSDHDAAHNMYERVVRITQRLPMTEQKRINQDYLRGRSDERAMSFRDFARFAVDYPAAYVSHLGKDAIVYFPKSGVEKLLLDYRDVEPSARIGLQDKQAGYRVQMEREGTLGAAQQILREHPALMILAVLGALLFTGMLGLAALGGWRGIRDRDLSLGARLMLGLIALFPFYVFLTSQVVNTMKSRLRAPAEFCICLLVAIGVRYLLAWWQRRGGSGVHGREALGSSV
jgi:4-amino-4-deoxy-L-arabinose transferase-like glycosyltransferase